MCKWLIELFLVLNTEVVKIGMNDYDLLEVDGMLGGSSKSESSSELSDINSTSGLDLLYIELASGNSKSESLLRGLQVTRDCFISEEVRRIYTGPLPAVCFRILPLYSKLRGRHVNIVAFFPFTVTN